MHGHCLRRLFLPRSKPAESCRVYCWLAADYLAFSRGRSELQHRVGCESLLAIQPAPLMANQYTPGRKTGYTLANAAMTICKQL